MSEKAFPCSAAHEKYFTEGMDLRDFFAAKAMAALITTISRHDGERFGDKVPFPWQPFHEPEIIVSLSYKIADAMMEAKNK